MAGLLLTCVALAIVASLDSASGHGYMTSPRSRNLLAFQETVWYPQTENDPQPETCPHCLNRGGSLAQCGIAQDMRNYDTPLNALGSPMQTRIQETYIQGQEVILNVTLTAHHKGHFEFSACPVGEREKPTKECFNQNKLTFIQDLLHGANPDPAYPYRAYVAPVTNAVAGEYVPNYGSTEGLMDFSFRMRLPQGLVGDLVLIQWYYLTANSCIHAGYTEYNWPEGWNEDMASASPCGVVSEDGTGVPEQFWNCAETRILANSDTPPSLTAPPTTQPTIATQTSYIAAGIPTSLTSGSIPSSLGSGSKPSSAGPHGKTIVGYYASWQWYDRNKLAAPENMDFSKVQRVNYAFFQTDTSGNIWGTDSWGDPNVLFGPYNWNPQGETKQYCSWDSPTDRPCNYHNFEQGLIHLVHKAGAELYPSLGGWTLSDPFPAMAANPVARSNFATNCVELIKAYDFDGIDIDWEYPGFEEHSGTPNDKENFRLLLDEVRSKLDEYGEITGRFYGLTAALPCGPKHIGNMDIAHVASTLSELNLMTYDFHGAFSATTGTNAPLYHQGWGEDDFSLHDCVENWLAGGGTKDKINIGLPFYGRSFAGATGLNEPHSGADQTVWGIDDGTPQYFNIMAQMPSMNMVWDKTTWTNWAWFDGGGSVSYDDVDAICAKTQYAIENELNGFIIWELSGDVMADLSTPLLDVVNKKLADPSYSCGEPGYYPNENSTPVSVTQPSPAVVTTSPTGKPVSLESIISLYTYAPTGKPQSVLVPVPSPPTDVVATITDPGPAFVSDAQPAALIPAPSPSTNDTPLITNPVDGSPTVYVPVPHPSTNTAPMTTNPVQSLPSAFVPVPAPLTENNIPTVSNPADPASTSLFLQCKNHDSTSPNPKRVELLFRYEMHRHPLASSTTVMEEIKASMMNDIANTLNCEDQSSVGRSLSNLRSNPTKSMEDHVVAILSPPSDSRNTDSPCTVPVKIANSASVCDSMNGSVTFFVDSDAPQSIIEELHDAMIFTIRTSMAAGRLETAQVLKAVFIEDLTVNPSEASASVSSVVWGQESEEVHGSRVAASLICFLVVVVTLVLQILFFRKAKRSRRCSFQENEAESMASSASHVEEVWKKALETYDSSRAIDPLSGTFVVTLGTDSSDNFSDDATEELPKEVEQKPLVATNEAENETGDRSDPPGSNDKETLNVKAQDDSEDEDENKDNDDCSDSNVSNMSGDATSELAKEPDICGVDCSGMAEVQDYVDSRSDDPPGSPHYMTLD